MLTRREVSSPDAYSTRGKASSFQSYKHDDMMTAVNTKNDSPHQLPKTQLWIPPTVIIRNPDTSERLPVFSVNIFFFRNGFLFLFFFCTWLWLFRAHSPSNGCSEGGQRLGWGDQKRLSKKPGRGRREGFLVFANTRAFSAFLGKGLEGREQRDVGSLLLFYPVHSTAHGKPLVVDSWCRCRCFVGAEVDASRAFLVETR